MSLGQKAVVLLLLVILVTGCAESPKKRPSYMPFAFDVADDKDTKLLSLDGSEVDKYSSSFNWQQVSSLCVRGTKLPLRKWKELDPLRAADRDDLLNLPVGRGHELVYGWSAVEFPNHKILLSGGVIAGRESTQLNSVWLFDPTTKSVQMQSPMLTKRMDHAMTILNDGRVLITGGESGRPQNILSGCEVYDPITQGPAPLCDMRHPRFAHSLVTLSNGRVLIVGGCSVPNESDEGYNLISCVELLNVDTKTCRPIGRLRIAREKPEVVSIGKEQALVLGGVGEGPPVPIILIEALKPNLCN